MDLQNHLADKHNVHRATEGMHVEDEATLFYGPAFPPEMLELLHRHVHEAQGIYHPHEE
jgi:hypothetical protein